MITYQGKEIKAGCYADGGLGHDHVRQVLADMVKEHFQTLAQFLRDAPSDDCGEEIDALSVLNGLTQGGYWDLCQGDLVLVPNSKEE